MIDWGSAISAGIGGGIGSALGIFLRLKKPHYNKTHHGIYSALLIAIPILILPLTPLRHLINKSFFPESIFHSRLIDFGRQLRSDSVISTRLALIEESQINYEIQRFSHQGLYYLDLSDLDNWNELRLAMATQSNKLCVGFFRGGLKISDFEDGLKFSSDDQVNKWFDLIFKAIKLGILNESLGNSDANKLKISDVPILASEAMSEQDSAKLRSIFINSILENDEEVCWAIKTLHKSIPALENSKRLEILKLLSSS